MHHDVFLDCGGQVREAAKHAVAQAVGRNIAKEPLDHVEPGCAGRGEMNMEAWVLGDPRLDLRMLVGRVVVADQMQRLALRRFTVDLAQEVEPLDMAMALLAAAR